MTRPLRLVWCMVLAVLPTFMAQVRAQDPTVDQVNSVLASSLVKVVASDCNSTSCIGEPISSTGFFVEHQGRLYIATALHGVAFYPQIEWSTPTVPVTRTSISLVNAQADVALLAVIDAQRVREEGFKPLPLMVMDEKHLPDLANQDVTALGYKLGLRVPTAETGRVRITGPATISELLVKEDEALDPHLDRFLDAGTPIIQLQPRLDPGDSGGPILLNGQVVGMSHGGLQQSSINWAIPAAAIAAASEDDREAFAPHRSTSMAMQALTIRLFNVGAAPRPTRAVTLPIRYTVLLRLSAQTAVLSGYLSRLRQFDTASTGGQTWTVGNGPLEPDSIEYPGGGANVKAESGAAGSPKPSPSEEQAEQDFVAALARSALQIRCASDQQLGQDGKEFWPADDHTLTFKHYFALDQLRFARETYTDRRDLYVHLDTIAEISPFGPADSFDLSPLNGSDHVTDQELDRALCHVEFVAAESTDISRLNAALAGGAACVAFFLSDGMTLQLAMTGQSFEPGLPHTGLLGSLYFGAAPSTTSGLEPLCGEKLN